MQHLRPCVSCSRHILASATRCPFCANDLAVDSSAPVVASAALVAPARLGRAARMALGAAVVTTASFVACGGDVTTPGSDASADGSSNDGSSNDGSSNDGSVHVDASADVLFIPDANNENIAMPYGAPPVDGLKRRVV